MNIKLDPGAIMPTRAHPTDAGLDLYSPEDFTIWGLGKYAVNTGVHIQIPKGCVGLLTSKSGLMLQNITSSGTIDEGYTGPITAVLFNHSPSIVRFKRGQKITQLVILPCLTPELTVVDSLEETERGDGGFGSTGLY